jgi:integrase
MKGHIRRRGKHSWEIKFDTGTDPATGRRATKYHSFRGTKREAEIEAARLVTAATAGELVDPSKVTLAEFLDRWERDWLVGNVSAKTAETYLYHLKHVRRHLGGTQLQKLRPVNFAELYARLLRDGRGEAGLSPRTIGHIHRIMHRAFGHAVQWGLLRQNVVETVDPPRVPSTEIDVLEPEQIQAVLNKLQGRTIYPIAALALATGMRRGELLALRWKDVDLVRASLRVERSVEQTKRDGIAFKEPKTRHGRRTISLPASIVAELRAHWRAQQEQRLALGAGKSSPADLVFPTWDGNARSPNALTKEWSVTMQSLGLAVTFHSLRHTHASHLIASGLDVITISRRLGHGSPAITLSVYGHLFPNTDDRAAEIVEASFAKARSENKQP